MGKGKRDPEAPGACVTCGAQCVLDGSLAVLCPGCVRAEKLPQHRIEVLVWREHGDDDDSLALYVFEDDDPHSATDLVQAEHNVDFGKSDGPGAGYSSDCRTLTNGAVLKSHDGKRFRLTLTEVRQAAQQ